MVTQSHKKLMAMPKQLKIKLMAKPFNFPASPGIIDLKQSSPYSGLCLEYA